MARGRKPVVWDTMKHWNKAVDKNKGVFSIKIGSAPQRGSEKDVGVLYSFLSARLPQADLNKAISNYFNLSPYAREQLAARLASHSRTHSVKELQTFLDSTWRKEAILKDVSNRLFAFDRNAVSSKSLLLLIHKHPLLVDELVDYVTRHQNWIHKKGRVPLDSLNALTEMAALFKKKPK